MSGYGAIAPNPTYSLPSSCRPRNEPGVTVPVSSKTIPLAKRVIFNWTPAFAGETKGPG